MLGQECGFPRYLLRVAELELLDCERRATERNSTLVTSNLPFQECTEVLGSERLTGALLDRLTHHVNIVEMNDEIYHLKQSKHKTQPSTRPQNPSMLFLAERLGACGVFRYGLNPIRRARPQASAPDTARPANP